MCHNWILTKLKDRRVVVLRQVRFIELQDSVPRMYKPGVVVNEKGGDNKNKEGGQQKEPRVPTLDIHIPAEVLWKSGEGQEERIEEEREKANKGVRSVQLGKEVQISRKIAEAIGAPTVCNLTN